MHPSLSSLLLFSPFVAGVNLYATHYSGNVHTLSFTTSGSTSNLSIVASPKLCGVQPSWLTLDASARTLYCLDESNFAGQLSSISAPANGGALTQNAKVGTIGNGLFSTLYSGTNGKTFLAVAHYTLNSISTWALPLTASSTALQSFKYTMAQAGPNKARQDAPHPHSTLIDPTGKFLLVPDLGADIIRIYSIDSSSGRLTSCSNFTTAAGVGPRHGVFWAPSSANKRDVHVRWKRQAASGTILYILNELVSSISSYTLAYPTNGSSGCLGLTLSQTVSLYPAGRSPPTGSKAAEIRIHGNGIVASNRGDNTFGTGVDSMATISLSSTGAMTFQNLTSAYGSFPRSFAMNKAGDLVAIATQNSAVVAVVHRDTTTGALKDLAASLQVGTPGRNENGGISSVIFDE